MALYKRGKKGIYYIRLSHPKRKGFRIQQSTGTTNKIKAQELHDKLEATLWDSHYLKKEPPKMWIDAVIKYISETKKATIEDDKRQLRWIDKHHTYLKQIPIKEITANLIEQIAKDREEKGASAATVNHTLQVIARILKLASTKWHWISSSPAVPRRRTNNKRIRWINIQEANRLLAELPSHLKDMAAFTLATGLRARNVRLLKWDQIDLDRQHAYIPYSETKNKKALSIPLNEDAIAILKKRPRESEYVFIYKGKPVRDCSTAAWKKALKRAQIKNFRWHDLRHTWASWHIQNGTTLQELQQLGGWHSFEMVLRYAHLSSAHLQSAASRIVGTKLVHDQLKVVNTKD